MKLIRHFENCMKITCEGSHGEVVAELSRWKAQEEEHPYVEGA